MIWEHDRPNRVVGSSGPVGMKLPDNRWFNASYFADLNSIDLGDVDAMIRLGVMVNWEGGVLRTKSDSVAVIDVDGLAAYLSARRLEQEVKRTLP